MSMSTDAVRSAVAAYYAAVSSGDVEAIAPLFAPEAVMRDPVGTPPLTDDAARRQRYARITAAFQSFGMVADEVTPAGDEAAARWIATGKTLGGKDVRFEGISTFVFDDDLRITAMSAYFDLVALTAQLQS